MKYNNKHYKLKLVIVYMYMSKLEGTNMLKKNN